MTPRDGELASLWEVTTGGGDDPALDPLLLRLHLETGAAEPAQMRLRDLDGDRRVVRLREKGGTVRWQPGPSTAEYAEISSAKKRIAALETEQEISWRAIELLEEQTRPKGGTRPSR